MLVWAAASCMIALLLVRKQNEAPPQGAGSHDKSGSYTPLLTARAWLVGASACLRPGRLGWSGSTQTSDGHP